MTTFTYTAKKNTETVTGQVDAVSEDEAIELINQLGLLPVAVEEKSGREFSSKGKNPRQHEALTRNSKTPLAQRKKIRSKELYIFSRQLSNLLKSGISLLRALMILEEQTPNGVLKSVISQMGRGIKSGKSFSECLARFPHIFSSLYITMVHAGEESGRLQAVLVELSSYQRRQEEIYSKVRMAMAYPLFMAGMGAATVYFILTFVLPKMSGLFENMGDALPGVTVVLMGVSQFLNKGGIWAVLVFGGIVYAISKAVQSEKGQASVSRLVLRLPLLGEMFLKIELARFCRTLVLLLASGISIIRALNITIPVLRNETIRKRLMQCKDDLIAGGSLGASIKKSTDLPIMMGHLVAVGEETGNLDTVLGEIAETYEQETDEKIKVMTTLLEPAMILIVGIVIGGIIFAMLLPIFQINMLVQ